MCHFHLPVHHKREGGTDSTGGRSELQYLLYIKVEQSELSVPSHQEHQPLKRKDKRSEKAFARRGAGD